MADTALSPLGAYSPFQGDYATYGQGPGHLFFSPFTWDTGGQAAPAGSNPMAPLAGVTPQPYGGDYADQVGGEEGTASDAPDTGMSSGDSFGIGPVDSQVTAGNVATALGLGLSAAGVPFGGVVGTLGNTMAHNSIQEAYGFPATPMSNFGKSLAHSLSFGLAGQSPAEAAAAMEDPDDVSVSPPAPTPQATNPDIDDDSGMNTPGSHSDAAAVAAEASMPNAGLMEALAAFGNPTSGAPSGAGGADDGPGPGATGPGDPGYSGSNEEAVDQGNNEGGTGGGTGDGTVICTALHGWGILPDSIYAADARFGQGLPAHVRRGYLLWARPVARLMTRHYALALALWPLVRPWALEIAARDGVPGVRGHWAGKLYLALGVPLCGLIGCVAHRSQARPA